MPEFLEPVINGRMIQFQSPNDSQLLILSRLLRRGRKLAQDASQADPDAETISLAMADMSKILDIIDAMIVKPEDQEFLEDLMIKGELNLSELLSVFEQSAQDEAPNRATKRAVAKKTGAMKTGTNRARTK